ncbi:hypothetical protein A2U01_0111197, partial [Trifolium medium]|nr:hypothetical protein [Trifolium medium]
VGGGGGELRWRKRADGELERKHGYGRVENGVNFDGLLMEEVKHVR